MHADRGGAEERFTATCPSGAHMIGFRGRAWAGQPEVESCVLAALAGQQSNPASSILYNQLVNLRDRIVNSILEQAAVSADPAWNGLFTVRCSAWGSDQWLLPWGDVGWLLHSPWKLFFAAARAMTDT